jgi:hypothetical protein
LVLAMNHWRFQAAVLTMPHLVLAGSMSSDVSWVRPIVPSRLKSGRTPSSYSAGVSCAPSVAFLWHRERVIDRARVKAPSFRMEAWTYTGTRLLAFDTSSVGDVQLDRILAASDERLLVRGLTGVGTPVVVEFAIQWPDGIRRQVDRPNRSAPILSKEP